MPKYLSKIISFVYRPLFIFYAIYTFITLIVSYTESTGSLLFDKIVTLIPNSYAEMMYDQRYLIASLFLVVAVIFTLDHFCKVKIKFTKVCKLIDDFQLRQGPVIADMIHNYQRLDKSGLGESTYDNLSRDIDDFLQKFTTYICRIVTTYTGRSCHVVIKTLNEGYISSRVRETSSSDPSRSSVDEAITTFPYTENTAFQAILEKDNYIYYLNNFLRLSSVMKSYKNSNPKWKKSYTATLVVPITLKTHPQKIDQENVWGFICADNKGGGFNKASAFILSSFARICYNVFEAIPIVNHSRLGRGIGEGNNDE